MHFDLDTAAIVSGKKKQHHTQWRQWNASQAHTVNCPFNVSAYAWYLPYLT